MPAVLPGQQGEPDRADQALVRRQSTSTYPDRHQHDAGAHHDRPRSGTAAQQTSRLPREQGKHRPGGERIDSRYPVGASRVVPRVRELLAEPTSPVPDLLRSPLRVACEEIATLEDNIRVIERQLADVAHQMATVPVLQT